MKHSMTICTHHSKILNTSYISLFHFRNWFGMMCLYIIATNLAISRMKIKSTNLADTSMLIEIIFLCLLYCLMIPFICKMTSIVPFAFCKLINRSNLSFIVRKPPERLSPLCWLNSTFPTIRFPFSLQRWIWSIYSQNVGSS